MFGINMYVEEEEEAFVLISMRYNLLMILLSRVLEPRPFSGLCFWLYGSTDWYHGIVLVGIYLISIYYASLSSREANSD